VFILEAAVEFFRLLLQGGSPDRRRASRQYGQRSSLNTERANNLKGRRHMIIGTFIKEEFGYEGSIDCLRLNLETVIFMERKDRQGNAPDFTVYARDVEQFEIGAAWKKTSKDGNSYLSVKLDGPTLFAPIQCALVTQHTGDHTLVWNRRRRMDEEAAGQSTHSAP
jgi:uncharacterized protein (DUF736 family)